MISSSWLRYSMLILVAGRAGPHCHLEPPNGMNNGWSTTNNCLYKIRIPVSTSISEITRFPDILRFTLVKGIYCKNEIVQQEISNIRSENISSSKLLYPAKVLTIQLHVSQQQAFNWNPLPLRLLNERICCCFSY